MQFNCMAIPWHPTPSHLPLQVDQGRLVPYPRMLASQGLSDLLFPISSTHSSIPLLRSIGAPSQQPTFVFSFSLKIHHMVHNRHFWVLSPPPHRPRILVATLQQQIFTIDCHPWRAKLQITWNNWNSSFCIVCTVRKGKRRNKSARGKRNIQFQVPARKRSNDSWKWNSRARLLAKLKAKPFFR